MYIELDLSVVPPISSLRDADDLERLTGVANRPEPRFRGGGGPSPIGGRAG
jgi:hypothetical protein